MNATFDSMMAAMGFRRVEDQESYEERAGILEYCAGLPRVKAEALARAEVETYRQHRAKVDADKVTK
jgi:hypothetical protein